MYDLNGGVTPEMERWLRDSGSNDFLVASAASRELAVALTTPLQAAVLKGDIVGPIFESMVFQPGQSPEYPLDFLRAGSEKHHSAYVIPNTGKIPERAIEGDYVMVPTFDVGNSIDWHIKYSKDARWDVAGRAMQVLEAGFVRKNNIDGMNTVVYAGKARGLSAYDDEAPAGLFTKRLVSLMKLLMRRNAGGNSTSTNRGKLTHLYVSPEAMEDVRSWDHTQADDFTRKEIYNSGDSGEMTIFGVKIIAIDELGVGQELQKYYTDVLGGTIGGSKTELVIGLDLSTRDSFVRPIREQVTVMEDPMLLRQRRAGYYAWMNNGWSVLDSRRVILGFC